MTTQQQVGIELLKEWATTEHTTKLKDNNFARMYSDGINDAKWQVKTILKTTGLL